MLQVNPGTIKDSCYYSGSQQDKSRVAMTSGDVVREESAGSFLCNCLSKLCLKGGSDGRWCVAFWSPRKEFKARNVGKKF